MSGWRGILAVEKDPMAFDTLRHNLIDGNHDFNYDWPAWFPQQSLTVEDAITDYYEQFRALRGKITLVAGGPPCQGFSLAGRRDRQDFRNNLFKAYIQIVRAVQPLYILLENVQGISMSFGESNGEIELAGTRPEPYSEQILRTLRQAGYEVSAGLLRAVDYGVPQLRPRYFLIGSRVGSTQSANHEDPFVALEKLRAGFLHRKGLTASRTTSVREAISDLETRHKTIECIDSPRFMQGTYSGAASQYQRLMRENLRSTVPDSHRLANHRPETTQRFEHILATCRKGVPLSQADRERLGLKKHCTIPLAPSLPSRTLTTLPDDIIHYSEPRILTVREYARLQSIPDWFQFRGNYTTGGQRRAHQCPRYTQAGNAVPPFVGEAIGVYLSNTYAKHLQSSNVLSEYCSDALTVGPVPAGTF